MDDQKELFKNLLTEGGKKVHRSTTLIKSDADAITELQKSRGWALLRALLEREQEHGIVALTGRIDVPRETLDFQRAALKAVRLLINLPEAALRQLETEYRLSQSYEDYEEEDK